MFYFSGSTLSDHSIQVEDNTNRFFWGSVKGDHVHFIEVTALQRGKLQCLRGKIWGLLNAVPLNTGPTVSMKSITWLIGGNLVAPTLNALKASSK